MANTIPLTEESSLILSIEAAAKKIAAMKFGELSEDDPERLHLRYHAWADEILDSLKSAIQAGKIRPRSKITGVFDNSLAFMGKRAPISLDDAIEHLNNEGMQLSAPHSGAPESKAPPRPMPQQAFQESEILRIISELNYDPKALPRDTPGKDGIKAEVRAFLPKFSTTVFNKAWERLSAAGDIIKPK